jgi:hypothetical protein
MVCFWQCNRAIETKLDALPALDTAVQFMLLLPGYGASWVLAHMAARRRLGVRSMFFLLPRALLPHLQHS